MEELKETRVKAIRKKCLDCSGGNAKEVRECSFTDCELYPFRMGKRPTGNQPAKAIRKYCKGCSGDNAKEVVNCPCEQCPIWTFRV